jgi:predicted esterase
MVAPVLIEAAATHTASLIFLHGLGDTGYGWLPVMQELAKKFTFMKFILPTAPSRPVTLNMGMAVPAWYDIYTLDEKDSREDQPGLESAVKMIEQLLEGEERLGIPRDRIFVGGFSQGGAVSIFSSLISTPPLRIAGIIALSAYMPCRKYVKEQLAGKLSRHSPIFLGHGTSDYLVQYSWHVSSAKFLKDLPDEDGTNPVIDRAYEGMGHSACDEEIMDVAEFIKAQLKKSKHPKDEL